MKPTDDLIREHKDISEMLGIMTIIASYIHAKKLIEPADVDFIVNFLINFADKCHHGKEETILMPALEFAGVKKQSGPLAVMMKEHTLGRMYIRDINTSVEKCKMGLPFSCELVADSLLKYVDLLKNHILKEEKILFPIVNSVLDDEKQDDIFEQFQRIERVVLSRGMRSQYSDKIKKLKVKYNA